MAESNDHPFDVRKIEGVVAASFDEAVNLGVKFWHKEKSVILIMTNKAKIGWPFSFLA